MNELVALNIVNYIWSRLEGIQAYRSTLHSYPTLLGNIIYQEQVRGYTILHYTPTLPYQVINYTRSRLEGIQAYRSTLHSYPTLLGNILGVGQRVYRSTLLPFLSRSYLCHILSRIGQTFMMYLIGLKLISHSTHLQGCAQELNTEMLGGGSLF